jgi:hypothetical protein
MDRAPNSASPVWVPISREVIDRAQFERAVASVRAEFRDAAADENIGLLDLAA